MLKVDRRWRLLSVILVILSLGQVLGQRSRLGLHRLDAQFAGEDASFLMDRTAQSGARWIIIRAHWSVIEPQAPTGTAVDVPGSRSGVHSYDWSAIDAAVADARNRGLIVVLQLTKGPDWATGAPDGCGLDLSESNPACGLIANVRKGLFTAAWHDFCYHAALRYSPQVRWFILWNEPNLPAAFNPEPPYDFVVNEYVRLILFPGRAGVKAGSPAAGIAGPELTTLDTYWGDWLQNGLDPLLRHFGDQFDVLTVHSYNESALFTLFHMRRIRDLLSRTGFLGQKNVWLTEFNFRNGTCNTSEDQLAIQIGVVLFGMDASWWTRSFYLALIDGPTADCGFGLLHAKGYREGPYLEKPLFGIFRNYAALGQRDRRQP